MTIADRLISVAARRWPADLAELLEPEWRAEIAAATPWRALRFAVSLAVSPAVEPEGERPVPRWEVWARSVAAALGVVLVAGVLFNGVQQARHLGLSALAFPVALAVMVLLGARGRTPVRLRTVLIGAGLFAFLLAGNPVAVMPFMGWRDITPAVTTWTILTTLLAYAVTRAPRGRVLIAVTGGVLTLDLAVAAGSLHAATTLGIPLGTAPAWFPLALLPGGTVTFGPPASGLPSSQLLLGNAAAMAVPMLLCSVYALTRAVRFVEVERASSRPVRPRAAFADPRTILGVTVTAAVLIASDLYDRARPGVLEATGHRLLDNSTAFGFGFLAHTEGRVVTALVAGLLVLHVAATRHRA